MSVPCMHGDWATRLWATRAIFIDFSGKRSAAESGSFIIADSRFAIHVFCSDSQLFAADFYILCPRFSVFTR